MTAETQPAGGYENAMTAGERAFTAWAGTSGANGTALMWTWDEMPDEQKVRWDRIAAAAAPPPQEPEGDLVGPLACLEEISDADWPGSDAVERIKAFARRELKAALAARAEGGALREVLEFYRDAWNSEPNGDPRIPGDASGSTTEPADELLADKGGRARAILAALPSLAQAQGERGGEGELVIALSQDEARLALWKAIGNIKIGNKTDDKLILRELASLGFWLCSLPNEDHAALSAPPATGWRPSPEDVASDAHRYALWMMHARGPDEIYPAPNYETAVEWADKANAIDRETNAGPPMIKAVPALWTGTVEAHAAGLGEAIAGWESPALPAQQEG